MGLLDEIQQLKAQSKYCIVGHLINALEEDDRKELLIAIDDPTIQLSKIVVALNRRGYKMSDNSMWKHRKKECSCVAR